MGTVEQEIQGVPLLDVRRQHTPLETELFAAMQRVCRSGQFVLGPDVAALEEEIACYCGVNHAIGCASGTDALLLALMAVGIEAGDEVILPSYTFFATAGAVWRLGGVPVFAEIDPASFNLDVGRIEDLITRSTKAVIPVHLFGQCSEMEPLLEIARRHGLAVIEDVAQAIGAEYRDRRAGSLGDIGCFSFYPTKNLGGYGDGGMLTTNNKELAKRLRMLRVHGMEPRYHHQVVGINSRLDSLQAAMLRIKLPHLDKWSAQRAENAARYGQLLAEAGLSDQISASRQVVAGRHVWNQYIVRIADGRRDALRKHLQQRGIGSEIYYPVPLHRQPCFTSLGCDEGSLPETEKAAKETLALPIFPELTSQEQETVVGAIAEYYRTTSGTAEAA